MRSFWAPTPFSCEGQYFFKRQAPCRLLCFFGSGAPKGKEKAKKRKNDENVTEFLQKSEKECILRIEEYV
jgi:hypothetical protein